MMRKFLFLPAIAALLLISCSESDKFNAGSKLELNISCEPRYQNVPSINTHVNISPIYDSEYSPPCYYYPCYWIIDGEISHNLTSNKEVSYGEHFFKFVLIDFFGDTLSDSCDYVRVDEPLKITLLSPIEKYEAEKTDTIVFQYKISGIDTWEEEPQKMVYISTDKNVLTNKELLWKNGEAREEHFLPPPLKEQTYYWGIKAFTEQDTAYSEIRSVWIKD